LAQEPNHLRATITRLGMGETPTPKSESAAKLKAKLSRLPPALSREITELVRKALPAEIALDRVLPYALLLSMMERRAQGEATSKEHARRSWRELAGSIHGLETGYRDEQEAAARYRLGRLARHRLGASLDGVATTWRKFQQLVEKHRLDLPVHNQRLLARKRLDAVGKTLEGLRTALFLENDVLHKERSTPSRSTTTETYSLWRFTVPQYQGKWSDMHRLAVVWRLTDAKDLDAFRIMVTRVPRPSQDMTLFIQGTWQSLFGKP
jgi:hypothetical protein